MNLDRAVLFLAGTIILVSVRLSALKVLGHHLGEVNTVRVDGIACFSSRNVLIGLEVHAVTVAYNLTTRSLPRSSYATSVDSTRLGWVPGHHLVT